jgi:hypothetical protein
MICTSNPKWLTTFMYPTQTEATYIGLPFISKNMFSRQPNEALSPCMVHEVCTEELAQEQI